MNAETVDVGLVDLPVDREGGRKGGREGDDDQAKIKQRWRNCFPQHLLCRVAEKIP